MSDLPILENKITTGNVLTILTAVAAVAVAWGAHRAEMLALKDRVVVIEATVQRNAAERAAALSSQDARIRTIEATSARDGARLDAILQAVQRIEARLERAGQ